MVSQEYCRLMARYNRWQNRSLVMAADGLSSAERWRDRGAFFGSIAATLNHLLWDDKIWMARLSEDEGAALRVPASLESPDDWATYKTMRVDTDAALIAWVDAFNDATLSGDVTWGTGGPAGRITRPRWLCMTHLYNHQTHHRGQVHAMLTAAGARPEETDLPVLPETEGQGLGQA